MQPNHNAWQAEDRVHRIGQESTSVNIQFLLVSASSSWSPPRGVHVFSGRAASGLQAISFLQASSLSP